MDKRCDRRSSDGASLFGRLSLVSGRLSRRLQFIALIAFWIGLGSFWNQTIVLASSPTTTIADFATTFSPGTAIGSRMTFTPDRYFVPDGEHAVFIHADTLWSSVSAHGHFMVGMINHDSNGNPHNPTGVNTCSNDIDVHVRYYFVSTPAVGLQTQGYLSGWFAGDGCNISPGDGTPHLLQVNIDRSDSCENACRGLTPQCQGVDTVKVWFQADGPCTLGLTEGGCMDTIRLSHTVSFGGSFPTSLVQTSNGLHSINSTELSDAHIRAFDFRFLPAPSCPIQGQCSSCTDGATCDFWTAYTPANAEGDSPLAQAYSPQNPLFSGERDFCSSYTSLTPCGCISCSYGDASLGQFRWEKPNPTPIKWFVDSSAVSRTRIIEILTDASVFWNTLVASGERPVLCEASSLADADIEVRRESTGLGTAHAAVFVLPNQTLEECGLTVSRQIGLMHINTAAGIAPVWTWDEDRYNLRVTSAPTGTMPMRYALFHEMGHVIGIDHHGTWPSPPPANGSADIPLMATAQFGPGGWTNVLINLQVFASSDVRAARCSLWRER